MIRIIIFFIFICTCFGQEAFAQEAQIKGKLIDSSAHKVITESSIVILRAKDSFLIADTRSDKDGAFGFKNIRPGKYILMVTHPRYIDYVDSFSIEPAQTIMDFNEIRPLFRGVLLSDVIISSVKAAIRLKKYTIEYAADSFHVPPNASVEDLLRQFPGLQVNKDGKITAQGKVVQKVLLDGEVFFGDDPTLITRNLKASMVSKVQIYDKTSDQSAFTGINDGQKLKTLNIKLKEDQKRGYFGNIEIGGATNKFYQNQAMFNSFRKKRKFAAYIALGNTGTTGLDRGSEETFVSNGASLITNNLDNWNGTYNGIGIPQSFSGGLHYDNKWNEDKNAVNTNYKFGRLNINGIQNSVMQINLPNKILYTTANQKTENYMLGQTLNAAYNVKLNPSATLKTYVEGGVLNKKTDENSSSETKRENFSNLNNSTKNTSTDSHLKSFAGNILWEKKLSKERRTLSVKFDTRLNSNYSNGNFSTMANFFDSTGRLDSSQRVDQYKTANNHTESYALKIVYTEPLGKYSSLIANYGILIDRAKAELNTFNRHTGLIDTNIDSLYSNNYQFDQVSNRSGLAVLYNRKKVRFQFGSDVAATKFDQQNLFNSSALKRSFTNWYPNLQLNYDISSEQSLEFSYNGNANQPTIYQLQPVANNNDPLNILVGNSNLKPTFSNNFAASFNQYKGVTSLFANGSFSFTNNPITISTQTDSSGKSVNTYVNLNNVKSLNYSGSIMYRGKLKLWNLDWGADGNIDGNEYVNLSNSITNITKANLYKLNFFLTKMKDKSYSVNLSFGPIYNVYKSSLQSSINNNSWGYNTSIYLDLYLSHNIQLHTDCDYTWLGKAQTFSHNVSRFIWNAWMGKKVLKAKNILFKISANDILNQNLGFRRSVDNNIIMQNNYNTIARYFMASIIWDFNKTGKNK